MSSTGALVLYVEDEETDRFLMERAFAKEGLAAALRMLPDGQAALDYLSGVDAGAEPPQYPQPSLVLLDLNLPEVPGFEVLQWIRARAKFAALPVVVFSSSAREDDQERCKTLGANDFIAKPNGAEGFRTVARRLHEQWLTVSRA